MTRRCGKDACTQRRQARRPARSAILLRRVSGFVSTNPDLLTKRDNLQLPSVRERRRKMKIILLPVVIASLLLISVGKPSSAQSSQTDIQSPDAQLRGTLLD